VPGESGSGAVVAGHPLVDAGRVGGSLHRGRRRGDKAGSIGVIRVAEGDLYARLRACELRVTRPDLAGVVDHAEGDAGVEQEAELTRGRSADDERVARALLLHGVVLQDQGSEARAVTCGTREPEVGTHAVRFLASAGVAVRVDRGGLGGSCPGRPGVRSV
jgi:hypothetical protein